MLSDEQLKEALIQLRAQSVIPESEIKSRFQKAIDIEYWRTLIPEMGVMIRQSPGVSEGTPLPLEKIAGIWAHFENHGYFQVPAVIPFVAIDRMRASIETIRSAGWPPVFSFIYDEFWQILRTPLFVQFLSYKLGAEYLQTSGIWTYRIDPRTRGSGWSPHVDSQNDKQRLTIWIPLTDATVGNGCMYVIPQDCVPPDLPRSFLDWTSVSHQELQTLLHNVKPLPAAAGSVLGWNNCLIHWGGRSIDTATFPRISMAAEFLPEGTKPRSGETPVFDAKLPEFRLRIRVIGQAIYQYEKFESAMGRYRGLAARLIEWGR